MPRTAARKRTTRRKPKQARRPDVFVVEQGADMCCDWTPQPPPEQSHFPKFVRVMGGQYDPNRKTFPGPDSIRVGITEGDPDGVSVYFSIYCVEANPDRPDNVGFMESFIYAEDVREIHAALGAAIEQAEHLGILPPCKPLAPELRVAPFEYVGERGAGGRWLGKKVPPRRGGAK